MHLKILATDMVPTLHQKYKFSTALHLTEILHLVLSRIDQVAWPSSHFKLPLLLQETSDWSKAKIVVTRGHLDMTEIIESSLAQVAGILKGDIHQIKDLVHDDPPAEAGETTIMMTTTNIARRMNINPIPTYQLEQKMKIGMLILTQQNHLWRGFINHTKQIRVVPPKKMTIPCHMTIT